MPDNWQELTGFEAAKLNRGKLGLPSPNVSQQTSVEGYCKPMSVRPGDNIDFHVSASVSYDVTYLRLTDLVDDLPGGGKRLPLLNSTHHAPGFQPTPPDAWRYGCNWKTSFSLTIPAHWASGIYAAECTGSDGAVSYIVFILKPSHGQMTHFAVLANTNTWNAYNYWGGRNRYGDVNDPSIPYTDITETSFERPNTETSPFLQSSDPLVVPPASTRAELWILKWLNDSGYRTDLYSDNDFHSGIADLGRYKALIVSTHPEYWTSDMLDHLESYLQGGGCLLYLGGNGIFECVQYNALASGLVYLGGTPGKSRLEFLFRNLHPPRPERTVLGVAFKWDNYSSDPAPYRVSEADHRFFAGTSLKNGDLIGQTGFAGAASGREMDSSYGDDALPDDVQVNTWVASRYDYGDPNDLNSYMWIPGTDRGSPPTNIELLAWGINTPFERHYKNAPITLEGPHGAHLTYYDTHGGGFVLSAGSIMFGGSLIQDASLQKLITNALNECLPVTLSYLAPLLL